jgi:putative MATE family efflux protein
MVSQNLLNLVDAIMVGRLGSTALAAVGIGGVSVFVANALLIGLSPAVQAVTARRFGEERHPELGIPLNGGILLSVLVGIPLAAALYALAPFVFPLLSRDPAVLDQCIPYFRACVCSLPAVGLNFAFRGYWNGINRPGCYTGILVLMNGVNIAANYVLIFGKFGAPALGTLGAGIGTALASWAGTALYFALTLRWSQGHSFLRRRPDAHAMRILLDLWLTSGLQHVLYALGMTLLFSIIGRVGTAELAATHVLVNLTMIGRLPAIGLGMVATSLVSQALGRQDIPDATRWAWDVMKVAVVLLVLIGLPMLAAPELILHLFTRSREVLDVGRVPIQLAGAGMAIEAVGLVMMNALMGAGDNRRVLWLSTSLQWGILLPGSYLMGPVLGLSLTAIWSIQILYRASMAVTFTLLWCQGRWKHIRI